MREAPSVILLNHLLENKVRIRAIDPAAMKEAKRIFGNKIELVSDIYEAVISADALIIATEWSEFRLPDFNVLSKLMNCKAIFDSRNILDKDEVLESGFDYFGIGRK